MPKRKSAPSLGSICLECVARNMKCKWVKDYQMHHLDGTLIQELLQVMGKKQLLTSTLLLSLLLPQLKELNLTESPHVMNRYIAHVIPSRCKNLTSLILCNCNEMLPDALADLIKGLPNLIKLDLSNTQCDTQVLSTVGTCCRNLSKLDISRCLRLSSDSLYHLAYDPNKRSFGCQALETLVLSPMISNLDLAGALVFLLLALPKLRFLVHDFLIQAVILIHNRQFEGAWMPLGFPSLEEMAQLRTCSNEGRPRPTLAIEEISSVCDSSLPAVLAVCPHLSEICVIFTASPDMGQGFWSRCQITRLSLGCLRRRDMRELLPVMERLGAQLDFFSVSGFFFDDDASFLALLHHCVNLRKLSVHLLSPGRRYQWEQPMNYSSGSEFSLPPREFPRLSDFTLGHIDKGIPLPSRHIILLEKCLESLLKYSPCLEKLELACLPFSLDEVFKKVLDPTATVLRLLRKLSLTEIQVSACTIHRLLSSENQLDHISMHSISSISVQQNQNLRRRVWAEGLDVDILWTAKP